MNKRDYKRLPLSLCYDEYHLPVFDAEGRLLYLYDSRKTNPTRHWVSGPQRDEIMAVLAVRGAR